MLRSTTEAEALPVIGELFRVPLRWRDLDNQGHVYHAEYLTLLDQARTAWLHKGLQLDNADEYIIGHISIDYIAELTFDCEALVDFGTPAVDITFAISRLGNKSLTVNENMYTPDGSHVARASTVLIFWDRVNRETRAITTTERGRAARYLVNEGSEV